MSAVTARGRVREGVRPWDAYFCVAAGGCDAVTGVLLVCAPGFTLGLLGMTAPGADLALLRFVGVFVACVGLAYLYPWTLPRGRGREARIVAAIELTAVVRLSVALFIGISVATQTLLAAWLTVGVVDAGVAIVQLVLLVRGFFGRVD